jgi:hypothetical protein
MTIYCVDTSALIAAWQERYPIENFPRFWDRLDAFIAEGRLVSPDEVLRETGKRSDELHAWLKVRGNMFRELAEPIQIEAAQVLARFPRLVGEKKLRRSLRDRPRQDRRVADPHRGKAHLQHQPAEYSRRVQRPGGAYRQPA